MNSILIFCIGLLLLLTGLLIAKKPLPLSNKILGLWLVITALEVWVFYIDRNGLYSDYPAFIGTKENFLLLHPPLLYFYVSSLNKGWLNPKRLVHFTPFVFFFGFNLFAFYLRDAEDKIALYNRAADAANSSVLLIIQFILIAYVFTYLLASYVSVKKTKRQLKHYLSFDQLAIHWASKLVSGYLIAWSVLSILAMTSAFNGLDISRQTFQDLSMGSFAIFIISVAILGLRQTSLFSDFGSQLPEGVITTDRKNRNGQRYAKSGLSDPEAQRLATSLEDYMSRERAYLNHKITLVDLAEALGTTTNHLSQVINGLKGKNFADYVNTYRIEAFKVLLVDDHYAHLSMLGLAMECGFNSKSAFNNAFKKHTGLTPSQYQQQQLAVT